MVPEMVQPFWAAVQPGEFITDAAEQAGTSRKKGRPLDIAAWRRDGRVCNAAVSTRSASWTAATAGSRSRAAPIEPSERVRLVPTALSLATAE